MIIRLSKLHEGINRWRETVTAEELELYTDRYCSDVTVDFDVEKRGGRVQVSISTYSLGNFYCDRCGDEFRRMAGGNLTVHFIKRESPLPDEMPGDELRSFVPGQDELDVLPETRDAMLLSIPMRMLCRDDCAGICPRCGANLNEGPCICERVNSNERN